MAHDEARPTDDEAASFHEELMIPERKIRRALLNDGFSHAEAMAYIGSVIGVLLLWHTT